MTYERHAEVLLLEASILQKTTTPQGSLTPPHSAFAGPLSDQMRKVAQSKKLSEDYVLALGHEPG